MCGITGFLKLAGAKPLGSPDEEGRILRDMNRTLIHRGPDDEGYLSEGPAFLAMRRLKIIDLTGGAQPIFNEDQTVGVVFNGEIYNYIELREELIRKGHRFKTQSDTEVLVHLYEEEREEFPKKLRGMYAFALWDSKARRLILGRDPFGIKPLYWGVFRNHLLFASEIKALIRHPALERSILPQAVDDLMTLMYIPAPATIYQGLFKLEPGHLLICGPESSPVKREFWPGLPLLEENGASRLASLPEALEALEAKISECVRLALRSDVPLGVFLSSGIDSATVASFAKQHKPDLRTLTLFFKEEGFSERKEALETARALGTHHEEVRMDIPEDIPAFVEKVLACFDEPFGDMSALPTYLLCQAARKSGIVWLSGDGGDELFAGYPTFQATLIFRHWQRLPDVIRKRALPALARCLPADLTRPSWDYKFKRFSGEAAVFEDWRQVHFAWRGAFSWSERSRLYSGSFWGSLSARTPFDSVTGLFGRVSGAPMLDQLLYADRMTYLADEFLVKVDRASMAHSLEVRPPFLDPGLALLAWKIPGHYKMRGHRTKWILRRLMKDRLPPEVIGLPKKGFTPPLSRWFQEARFQSFVRDAFSANAFRQMGMVQPEALDGYLKEHAAGRVDHTRRLWVLLSLALFAQRDAAQTNAFRP